MGKESISEDIASEPFIARGDDANGSIVWKNKKCVLTV